MPTFNEVCFFIGLVAIISAVVFVVIASYIVISTRWALIPGGTSMKKMKQLVAWREQILKDMESISRNAYYLTLRTNAARSMWDVYQELSSSGTVDDFKPWILRHLFKGYVENVDWNDTVDEILFKHDYRYRQNIKGQGADELYFTLTFGKRLPNGKRNSMHVAIECVSGKLFVTFGSSDEIGMLLVYPDTVTMPWTDYTLAEFQVLVNSRFGT